MDAHCNGCGGRVMPYRQYAIHFRPTAVCGCCGHTVRLRHFRRVLAGFLLVLLGYAAVMAAVPSRPLLWAAFVLAVLACLLADFWTYRNLTWDPADDAAAVTAAEAHSASLPPSSS